MYSWILVVIVSFFCIPCLGNNSYLQKLIEGNERFVKGALTYPDRSIDERAKLQEQQAPFAVILSCADSRVGPELIFDQGLGDLFVVRVAGNIAADVILESINYAAVYLHSHIILVLGHQNCGAVKEILDGNEHEIPEIAAWIGPAIRTKNTPPTLEEAIKMNVRQVVTYLQSTPALANLVEEKQLEIVGGYYHFDSGIVELITPYNQN